MTDAGALVIADAIRQVAGALALLGFVSLLYVAVYAWRWMRK